MRQHDDTTYKIFFIHLISTVYYTVSLKTNILWLAAKKKMTSKFCENCTKFWADFGVGVM